MDPTHDKSDSDSDSRRIRAQALASEYLGETGESYVGDVGIGVQTALQSPDPEKYTGAFSPRLRQATSGLSASTMCRLAAVGFEQLSDASDKGFSDKEFWAEFANPDGRVTIDP